MTTRTRRRQKSTTQLSATGNPLFLHHVEPLHPHRDSGIRLDDPILSEEEFTTETTFDKRSVDDKMKSLHKFTSHLAPIVLALYMIGHYLGTYHTESTALINGGGDSSINVDPMFGGYVLIATGLALAKW
eukprot:CAMPEP_0172306530 /NCGR_PEP_ID=MMETSP1058-20130122/7588_1 /TAXON_ID=83371 /ORGANISM="Detonula confervacea, Strain CCMP 353" /LENGTH=129 /DNA_ID=CAMNT_0013018451 /DNA_START=65 /DNA_END=451 /DNA_ORIENTATION=-